MNIAKAPVLFPPSTMLYQPQPGQFVVPTAGQDKVLNWNRMLVVGCRDGFHSYVATYKITSYFFGVDAPFFDGLAEFVDRVEAILGLPPEDKVLFSKVDGRNDMAHVQPQGWWQQQRMRHQFLTCVMRVGKDYRPGGDLWQGLTASPYFIPTLAAMFRFLDGYTIFTGQPESGWVRTFALAANLANLKSLLVRPDSSPPAAAEAVEAPVVLPAVDAERLRAARNASHWMNGELDRARAA